MRQPLRYSWTRKKRRTGRTLNWSYACQSGSWSRRDDSLKFMIQNLHTAMNKILMLISLLLLTASAWAETPPSGNVYVGAISIEPCHEAKVLADWYSLLG